MFYVSYEQVWVYRVYRRLFLGEELTHRQGLITCCLSFGMWSFTMEIVKQSWAQISNNLSKSISTKMSCDSYSLLILPMQKIRHLVNKHSYLGYSLGQCRDMAWFESPPEKNCLRWVWLTLVLDTYLRHLSQSTCIFFLWSWAKFCELLSTLSFLYRP